MPTACPPRSLARPAVSGLALGLLLLVQSAPAGLVGLVGTAAAAESGGQPLPVDCAAPPAGDPAAPPVLRLWTKDKHWRPPACTGWGDPGFQVLMDLAGTIRGPGEMGALLDRLGAISTMEGLRYWSTRRKRWEVLITDAAALSGPAADLRRADFTAGELTAGAPVHFVQEDNRSGETMVYRLTLREVTADRLVVAVDNVTPAAKLIFTMADPGSLQALHILERLPGSPNADAAAGAPGGLWSYRMLSRTSLGASSLFAGRTPSLANRAMALYRFVAGIPDTTEPPAAP
ncbi:MAG: hypothetical protein RLY86_545 [Pseudomonadota bacterium]|jgi:hypothetical protein